MWLLIEMLLQENSRWFMEFNATFNNISKMTVIIYVINLTPNCTGGCSQFKSLMTTNAMQIPSLMATES